MKVKKSIKSFIAQLAPYQNLSRRAKRRKNEPGLKILSLLCDKNKISIDVGANEGIYSYYMLKHSEQCIAFEPIPHWGKYLRQAFKNEKYELYPLALSNQNGVATLKMPVEAHGLSSIEAKWPPIEHFDEKIITYDIETKRLDEYKFNNIGFIKIDVEGHEESVIEGAINTITKSLPNLMIEIDGRHNKDSLARINKELGSLGYHCFFYFQDELLPLKLFDFNKHQNQNNLKAGKEFVLDFIFLTDTLPELYFILKNSE